MNESGKPKPGVSDVAAFFDGGRLTLARHLAGLRKNALAHRVGKTPTAIAGYESGNTRPSAATVAQLSLALGVEAGFFAARPLDLQATSGVPHFRSLRSTTQIARDQAHAYGLLAADVAVTFENYVEFPGRDIISYPVSIDDSLGTGPEEAARETRKHFALEPGRVPHLVRLMEHRGVLTVFSPLQAAPIDAYSIDTQVRPVILLNPLKQDHYRQRYDAAHELGHLIMHLDAEPGSHVVEEQANRFAAEFLMPGDEIIGSLPHKADWLALGRLKESWGVSIQALLFRARRLGIMSDVTYRNAMAYMSSRGWRRQEPGLMPSVEQPSLLPRAIEILSDAGIDQAVLMETCRVPANLFRVITSRAPAVDGTDLLPSRDNGNDELAVKSLRHISRSL